MKEDDSVLLGSATADKSNEINKAALNSSLNVELDKINESLLKIGLILNVSSFNESQSQIEIYLLKQMLRKISLNLSTCGVRCS